MTVDISKLLDVKGQFVRIEYKSEQKPAAAHKTSKLEKRVLGVFRAGIDYANLGTVKTAIADGSRGEVQALPWGEWESFPYTIRHNGKLYVRLYPAKGAASVTYFVDGNEVTREQWKAMLTPGDARKMDEKREVDCFTVKAENILAIGNES